MPSEQRLHPVSILFAFGGSLKAFALPGLLVLVLGRSSPGGPGDAAARMPPNWEVWLMLFLVPAALLAVARYVSFRVRYEHTELIIRSGLVFRNERHIPYARIQNLEAIRNVFHRLFGVIEVRVQNASGRQTEATISVLPIAALEEMRRRVAEGQAHGLGAPREPVGPDLLPSAPEVSSPVADRSLLRLSLPDLLLFGFLENRGLIVIGAIYGVLWEYGPLAAFWSRIAAEGTYGSGMVRDTVRTVLAGGRPPLGSVAVVLAGIVGFLLVVRLISMAWAAIRLHDFQLTLAGDDLRTEFGLFTRVSATIPRRRIQTMTIRAGPWHRRLKRVTVRVETAGGTGRPGGVVDREWLAPLVPVAALRRLMPDVLPGLDLDAIEWRPVHARAFRRAVKPAMVLGVGLPLAAAAVLGGGALWILPVTVSWSALVARRQVARLGWSATEDFVAFRSGWLWRVVTVARVAKIQAVALRESPFDRRTAMARVRVDTAGASDRSVRVDIPYLPIEVASSLHRRLAASAGRTDFRW